MRYVMHKAGSTRGAVTGRYHVWSSGQVIEAPEGEFDHLRGGTYETRPLKPAASSESPGPKPKKSRKKGKT